MNRKLNLLIVLILLFILFLADCINPTDFPIDISSRNISHNWQKYNITTHFISVPNFMNPNHDKQTSVFIHAALGIFKDKKQGKTVNGLEILIELIDSVYNSSLGHKLNNLYVVAIGDLYERQKLHKLLKLNYNNAFLIAESSNLELVTFILLTLKFSLNFI